MLPRSFKELPRELAWSLPGPKVRLACIQLALLHDPYWIQIAPDQGRLLAPNSVNCPRTIHRPQTKNL